MPKLTVKDADEPKAATPSAELIQQAMKEETLTDAKGRSIMVRKPGVLAQFRLTEAAGPEAAANQTYMQMIQPLIYVAEIDGETVHLPATKREIDALIVRLDDDGLAVVYAWYTANVIKPTLDAVAEAERAAQIKN